MLNQDINCINNTKEISRQIECMFCTIHLNLTDRHNKTSLNSQGTTINQYTCLKLLYNKRNYDNNPKPLIFHNMKFVLEPLNQ